MSHDRTTPPDPNDQVQEPQARDATGAIDADTSTAADLEQPGAASAAPASEPATTRARPASRPMIATRPARSLGRGVELALLAGGLAAVGVAVLLGTDKTERVQESQVLEMPQPGAVKR